MFFDVLPMKKSLLSILLLVACSNGNISENRDRLLKPLREEAVQLCLENNSNPSLYVDSRYNSWVSYRKNRLLELAGCKPGSIKWICEEKEFQSSYVLRERKYGDNCEDDFLDLEKLKSHKKLEYLRIIQGLSPYSYHHY